QLKRADALGARFALVLGDAELKADRAKLKEMKTGAQHEVSLSGLAGEVKKLTEGSRLRPRRQSSCGRRWRTCRGRSLPAGLAQPAGEHLHHAHGDLRALAEDVAKVVAADLQQDRILDGGDAGRPGLRIEHRHLPQPVALAEPHQLLAALVHLHLSFA